MTKTKSNWLGNGTMKMHPLNQRLWHFIQDCVQHVGRTLLCLVGIVLNERETPNFTSNIQSHIHESGIYFFVNVWRQVVPIYTVFSSGCHGLNCTISCIVGILSNEFDSFVFKYNVPSLPGIIVGPSFVSWLENKPSSFSNSNTTSPFVRSMMDHLPSNVETNR